MHHIRTMQAQPQEVEPISESDLQFWEAENVADSKTTGIIGSSSAIISLISSSILIWILNRSNARFSSIYHRMLLGISVADICYSLSIALFNSTAPSDVDYYVWNARGNQATCSAQSYVAAFGAISSVFYTCSLNLYSLAVVKYNKRDSYIRTKIEPFLHGVPIGWGFIYATTLLVGKNLNNDGAVYEPPHCIGYADGEVREGFEIPCGRGRDGAVLFFYLGFLITFFAAPIIIGGSLWMIYRAVKKQEQVIARYGAGAFAANTTTHQTSSSGNSNADDEGINHRSFSDRLSSSIRSAVSFFNNSRSSGQSSSASNIRVVMRRAFAFTISYFLTWTWFIIAACFGIASNGVPPAIWYLIAIFNPLQGFFNLCIFLQPTVLKIKSRPGNDTTWCQAVMEAIWYSGRGDQTPGNGEGRGGGHATKAQQPQPVEGERRDDQPETSQTQRISLETQEDVKQAPGVDRLHDSYLPSVGNNDQSDTMEP